MDQANANLIEKEVVPLLSEAISLLRAKNSYSDLSLGSKAMSNTVTNNKKKRIPDEEVREHAVYSGQKTNGSIGNFRLWLSHGYFYGNKASVYLFPFIQPKNTRNEQRRS